MHFVTSVQAEDHVSDLNVARFNTGVLGAGVHVLPIRGQFAATMVDSNTLRVLGGDAVVCGRHVAIDGDYEEISIENGTPGMKRIDLVVMHVELEASAICELRVLKGAETTGTPVAPTHIEGDLNDGDTVTEVPICSVLIDGINPQEPVNLIQQHLLMPISDIRDSLSQCPYAVGDIYQTFNSGDPSARWPGTVWQQITGRFLRAANDTDTGGSDTKTLAVANMPPHVHNGPSHSHGFSVNSGLVGYVDGGSAARQKLLGAGSSSGYYTIATTSVNDIQYVVGNNRSTGAAGTGATSSTGSGTAFDVRPAYQDVYTWRRTA